MVEKIPDKYWLYPFAALALISMPLYLSDGIIQAVVSGLMFSTIFIGALFSSYTLWYGDSIFYKITALFLCGLIFLPIVIIIQILYVKFILKEPIVHEKSTLLSVGWNK